VPVLIAIFRIIFTIGKTVFRSAGHLGFIWRFFKVLSVSSVAWTAVSFAPLLITFYEMITGKGTFFTTFLTNFAMSIFTKIFKSVIPVNISDQFSQLSATVLDVSCYLGATEAIQILINGIVGAMTVITILKVNVFIAKLKMSLWR